jgi:hypothetical protein
MLDTPPYEGRAARLGRSDRLAPHIDRPTGTPSRGPFPTSAAVYASSWIRTVTG